MSQLRFNGARMIYYTWQMRWDGRLLAGKTRGSQRAEAATRRIRVGIAQMGSVEERGAYRVEGRGAHHTGGLGQAWRAEGVKGRLEELSRAGADHDVAAVLGRGVPDDAVDPSDGLLELRHQKPARAPNVADVAHQVAPWDHQGAPVSHASPVCLVHCRIAPVTKKKKQIKTKKTLISGMDHSPPESK